MRTNSWTAQPPPPSASKGVAATRPATTASPSSRTAATWEQLYHQQPPRPPTAPTFTTLAPPPAGLGGAPRLGVLSRKLRTPLSSLHLPLHPLLPQAVNRTPRLQLTAPSIYYPYCLAYCDLSIVTVYFSEIVCKTDLLDIWILSPLQKN